MITNCPVCGKGFDVLWPHLWRYKRGKSYLCSWKCLRLADSKRKEEVMDKTAKRARMSAGEMVEAVRLFREGDSSLDQYLTDHGVTNIPKWKANTKQRYGVPKEPTLGEAMTGMKDAADEFFGKCKEMGLKLDAEEAPEQRETYHGTFHNENRNPPPPPPPPGVHPPIEYRVTGISTAIGDFQYFKKSGYIDWTPLDGNGTVSMNLEEWKELMKIWPFVLKVLEVEL